jgi:zona occludens toxin
MIQFVTGIPGSGKSYYGLFSIAINFNKTLQNNKKFKNFQLSKTKYKVALTNINEIKFESFENVKPLNFEEFKSIITKLHNQYKLGKTDSELEEIAKDEDFFNTLIVLDECHNFMGKDDEVLIWWLSYHRHFFQDIILITQDLPLVHKKYKAFSEFYYKAMPSSRKLFNTTMNYQQYNGSQMYKTQLALTKKLPILKEVFQLYGSGENNKQKSLVRHFLILATIIFIIVLIAGVIYLKNFFGGGAIEKDKIQTPQQSQKLNFTKEKKNNNNSQNGEFYEMYCNFSYCFINSNIYEKKFILELLKREYKATILANSKHKYYFQTEDKFNLFQKKSKKEDIKNEENSILPSFNLNNK